MHPFFEKVKKANARLIPYVLIALLILIVLELAYHTENYAYNLILRIIDYLIIAIFTIDLIFIAKKCKTARYFFKNYFLDLLAVFPFGLLFYVINEFYRIFTFAERIAISQAIFHETLELEKGVKIAAEGEKMAKLPRFLRVGVRLIRFVTKSKFFTAIIHPKHKAKRGE